MILPISLHNSVQYFCSETIPKAANKVYDFARHILSNYYYVMPGIALTLGHYNDTLLSSLVCAHDSVNWLVNNETVRSVSSLTFLVPVSISLAIRISRFVLTGSSFNAISVLLQAATLAKILIIKIQRVILMSNILVSGLTAARDAATNGVTAAIHCYIWAGRKVELYSHKYLPELAAKVVSAVMWTLPYTAAAVFAPKFVFFAGSVLLIGFWNGIGKDLEETIGKEQRQHLFNGLRNGSMIRAAVVIHSVAVAATSGWVVAVALQCLFIGYQAHLIARQDAPPPPPAAEPATTGA